MDTTAAFALSDREFSNFQRFIYDAAGIALGAGKKALVCGRLARRLELHRLDSYEAYYRMLVSEAGAREAQTAIDLLTTNETYFFREARHFELLREVALAARPLARPFRVWSAACSSGEEAYSCAMVLDDCLRPAPWEVLGSDISTRMLDRARRGHYPMTRIDGIPPDYLRRYCLKGIDAAHGSLLVGRELRQRVRFEQINLNLALPALGEFDIVFLRNVMIYFNRETRKQVLSRILSTLKPGGYLCVGHSESLNELGVGVRSVAPSIYRKI